MSNSLEPFGMIKIKNKNKISFIVLISSVLFLLTLFNVDCFAYANDAKFISQNVPTIMTAGKIYSVSVTMENVGASTWTEAANYRLGSQNPQDNNTWGLNRVYLASGESVVPGQNKTFTFNVTAPSTPGVYNFQWRMVQDGVEWFGEKTSNVAVSVVRAVCTTGQVSGCEVCLADESGWADDNSKCAGNQICRNGLCLKNLQPL